MSRQNSLKANPKSEAVIQQAAKLALYRESVKEFFELLGWSPARVRESLRSIDNTFCRKIGQPERKAA